MHLQRLGSAFRRFSVNDSPLIPNLSNKRWDACIVALCRPILPLCRDNSGAFVSTCAELFACRSCANTAPINPTLL
jgi:hypothetical protein